VPCSAARHLTCKSVSLVIINLGARADSEGTGHTFSILKRWRTARVKIIPVFSDTPQHVPTSTTSMQFLRAAGGRSLPITWSGGMDALGASWGLLGLKLRRRSGSRGQRHTFLLVGRGLKSGRRSLEVDGVVWFITLRLAEGHRTLARKGGKDVRRGSWVVAKLKDLGNN
jgi:hypothetical protein